MKVVVSAVLILLAATTLTGTAGAAAAGSRHVDAEICRSYGFPPHKWAFSACLMNVRHYFSAGPCADWNFASVHKRYCNVIPEADF